MFDLSLRESSLAQEGPLLVSKPLKLPVLLDLDEMGLLLEAISKVFPAASLFQVHGACKKGEERLSFEAFLSAYETYINELKVGRNPNLTVVRIPFSCFLSCCTDILYAIPVGTEKRIIKATRPIIQIQINQMHYSKESDSFHPMSYGQDNIQWGLQFSYPQLFQDPKTQAIEQVREQFPNTALFKLMQNWMREHTLPTPFMIEGRKKSFLFVWEKNVLNGSIAILIWSG